MVSKPRAFIDSNIFANWMLLSGAIARLKPQDAEKLKVLKEIAGRRWPSYMLLESLRALGRNTPILFGSSTFAVAETSHVILQEYIASRLHSKGVPFEFWDALRNRERLTHVDERDLYNQQLKLLVTFFEWKKGPLRWYDPPDMISVQLLITSYRVSTTDAFLIGQARKAKCHYFVTEDRPLRDLLSKYPEIQVISAQTTLDELKTVSRLIKLNIPP